jgi:hypothetical protein
LWTPISCCAPGLLSYSYYFAYIPPTISSQDRLSTKAEVYFGFSRTGKKSSNFAALSELGRLPTHFNIVKAMLIIFWHRLQNLDNQFPILKDAFKTSIQLHIDKLPSWYGSINVIEKLIFDNKVDTTSPSTNSF